VLADLASAQHGVVARSQLMKLGFSRQAIEHRLNRGRLHRVHWGVYAVGHPGLTREGRWMAALLVCGPEAVLSHRSAATAWDIYPSTRTAVDVIAPRARRGHRGVDAHVVRSLDPADVVHVHGLRRTTVARTLVDLASLIDRAGVERAWRRAAMLDLLDVRAVERVRASGRGRRGAGLVRSLLAEDGVDGITRSQLEEHFLTLCRSASLPLPEVNTRIDANGTTYEVDFLWRQHHLVAETDGWGPHHTRAAFESDRRRDADLLVAGLRVVRFTWRQITREPGAVAATLGALLQA
jgi:very-short-patch-repair endonuclease